MKNRTAITLTAMAGLLTLGTAAEAATFTYTLTNPTITGGVFSRPLTSSPTGFPGTISAFKDRDPSFVNGPLNVATNGTGVASPPPSQGANVGKDATNQEALRINIPAVGPYPIYRLVSATFTNLAAAPTARAFAVQAGTGTPFNITAAGTGTTATVTPTTFISGNSFDFFVLNNDGQFRLESATFATVPEPLTILGTGFAAAALPALKKANKKAKK